MGGEDNVGGMVDGEWEIFAQMLNGDVTDGIGPTTSGSRNPAASAKSPTPPTLRRGGQQLERPVPGRLDGDDNVGSLVLGEYEIFIQRMDGMAVFVDPFESGDTTGWSSVMP